MLKNSYCFYHNPDVKKADKKEAQSRGGKGNKSRVSETLPPITFKKSRNVVGLLEETINLVRAGKMEIRVANCIGYLSGHIIKAIEVSELTQRLQEVEKKIEIKWQE